ncbi:MAG: hypothetical protein NXI26_26255, partial [bacterium]|nr:hypothetical protein [bacterium]
NWVIQSIDRNQQNSGSKTNYSRFSKAGLIPNRLFISFLFPKWSAPNGSHTCLCQLLLAWTGMLC